MVTKVTKAGMNFISITIPGTEAEYLAIMKALLVATSCINEDLEDHIEARQTISKVLMAMLPVEKDLILPNANNNIRAAKVS